MTEPAYLLLGTILRPHGVRGEVRMRILTDYPQRLLGEIEQVYIGRGIDDKRAKPYTIQTARFHKNYLLIKFAEIPARDEADTLRDLQVMIDRAHAVPLEDGEFYLYELIGLHVKTDTGKTLGTIAEVLETGANDVYIVRGGPGGEILIPAHDETVLNIDFDAQEVTVKLPEGLLPD